ncbi:galactokinase family protein [Corynebacterium renale]|uniref:galactokinase family protein n=1 Tax=Corynebacterium renale TaxID=1724 RepID=UPI0013791429
MSHEFPTPDCLTRAANIHEETYGTPGTISGHAPGVWVTIGEHIDTFGGLALLHHVEQRVAVVASPREDSTVAVTASFAASLSDSSTQALRSRSPLPSRKRHTPFRSSPRTLTSTVSGLNRPCRRAG